MFVTMVHWLFDTVITPFDMTKVPPKHARLPFLFHHDFTAHMCTGMILSIYKLFVNPLFKLISIEHVIVTGYVR